MSSVVGSSSPSSYKLTILHFNDLHGFLDTHDDGKGGACNLAGDIERIKKENEAEGRYTIVLVGGDTTFGTPVSKLSEGQAELEFLDGLADVMVVGNHEFEYGQDRFEKNIEAVPFPVISANIYEDSTNELLVKPTHIIKLADKFRVGIVGLTTPLTPSMSKPSTVKGLKFTDPLAAAKEHVDKLSGETEIQIVLGHMSNAEDESLLVAMPAGIELYIGGHDHMGPEYHCKDVKGIPMCETPPEGSYLGRIDLVYENGKTTIEKTALLPVVARENETCPEGVEARIGGYMAAAEEWGKKVVCEMPFELKHLGEEFRGKQTPLGQFTARAMRDEAGAEVGVINGGSVRGDLKKGTITEKDLYKVFPFETYVVKVRVSGNELMQIVKRHEARVQQGRSAYNWAGLTFERNGENLKVEVGGKPLDVNEEYSLATADFLVTTDFVEIMKGKTPEYTDTLLRSLMARYISGLK